MHTFLSRNSILLITAVFLLQSCITTQKVQTVLEDVYQDKSIELTENHPTDDSILTDRFVIENAVEDTISGVANTVMFKSHLTPAILYWNSERIVDCYLNSTIPFQILKETLSAYKDTSEFKALIDTAKLTLKVNTLPTRFSYEQQRKVVLMVFVNHFTKKESISPHLMKWEVDFIYSHGKNKQLTGSHVVEKWVPRQSIPFSSTQKLISHYISNYEDYNKELALKLIREIMEEIDASFP